MKELGTFNVPVVSALPGTAVEGQLAVLSTDHKLYRHNGTSWVLAW